MQRYKSFFAFASVFEKTSKNPKNHSSDKRNIMSPLRGLW
jgi:hypothetical protein